MIENNFTLKEQTFLKLCTPRFTSDDLTMIEKALLFSRRCYAGCFSGAGEPTFTHALAVATIVVNDLNLDAKSVSAALLHNVFVSSNDTFAKELTDTFDEDIIALVYGLTRVIELDTKTISVNADSFRNLVISLAGDLRVVLIKIADQLDIMRKLDPVSDNIKSKFCLQTKYLYAPLAHRLGLYNINSELNTLVIKYLENEAYLDIVNRLESTEDIRETYIRDFIEPIDQVLKSEGFSYKIKGRTKSIFSIWNKTRNKGVSFEEVYDLFAIRIVLDTPPEKEKADCWQVYSLITEKYEPSPERLRDWISVPRKSGYESLHTTVLGPENHWIEVQIRTARMDEIAEKGLAAHWKYKGGSDTGALEKWLADIRDVLEADDMSIGDVLESLQTENVEDEVFVFTPAGDLKRLRKGASLLDFAYNIHSEVGDHCVGGSINGKKVGIRHKLKSGDRIFIETSKTQSPKSDWLNFVVTGRARLRIRTSLNEEISREAENGKEIIKRKLKNWKLDFNNENINLMVKALGYKFGKDLYYDISTGKLDPLKVKAVIIKSMQSAAPEIYPELSITPRQDNQEFKYFGETLLIEENITHVAYKMARCCNPVFGDKIFGFITITEGIKIHRNNCPNAKQLKERYPYRIIAADWHRPEAANAFLATLFISGADDMGIVNRITYIITTEFQMQMNSVRFNSNKGEFHGEVQVYVRNIEHLDILIDNLKKIDGVISVSRSGL